MTVDSPCNYSILLSVISDLRVKVSVVPSFTEAWPRELTAGFGLPRTREAAVVIGPLTHVALTRKSWVRVWRVVRGKEALVA